MSILSDAFAARSISEADAARMESLKEPVMSAAVVEDKAVSDFVERLLKQLLLQVPLPDLSDAAAVRQYLDKISDLLAFLGPNVASRVIGRDEIADAITANYAAFVAVKAELGVASAADFRSELINLLLPLLADLLKRWLSNLNG